jgi:hypothetical protein
MNAASRTPYRPAQERLQGAQRAILDTFAQMDVEASNPALSMSSGLQWYHGSRHKFTIKRRWLRELKRRLDAQGFPTRLNVAFEHGEGRCDCVVALTSSVELWLEVVGVWKAFSCRIGQAKQYRCALFHPLIPNAVPGINTVPNSIQRLHALDGRASVYAGVLLLGFDTPATSIEQDVEVLARISELRESRWTQSTRSWITSEKLQERVCAYLWGRAG